LGALGILACSYDDAMETQVSALQCDQSNTRRIIGRQKDFFAADERK
jgi:hypothetical protein